MQRKGRARPKLAEKSKKAVKTNIPAKQRGFLLTKGRRRIKKRKTRFSAGRFYPGEPLHRRPIRAPLKSDYLSPIIFGGPRLNFGLFGLTNKHYYLATKAQEKETKPFSDGGTLNPLDYSLGIGTGIEVSHFQFLLGYDLPLSNSSKDEELSQLRQHNFRFSVAYTFRRNKKK